MGDHMGDATVSKYIKIRKILLVIFISIHF